MIFLPATDSSIIVTGDCVDCHRQFTGKLGMRFIEINEVPGIELLVIDPMRNEMHTLARVERHLVPTVDEAEIQRHPGRVM